MEWLEQRFSDDDRLSIEAIRNIYIDPEEVDGTTLPFAEHQLAGEPEEQLKNIKGGSGDPSKDAADAIIKSIQGMAEIHLGHVEVNISDYCSLLFVNIHMVLEILPIGFLRLGLSLWVFLASLPNCRALLFALVF